MVVLPITRPLAIGYTGHGDDGIERLFDFGIDPLLFHESRQRVVIGLAHQIG